jgi:hypothetical protein
MNIELHDAFINALLADVAYVERLQRERELRACPL